MKREKSSGAKKKVRVIFCNEPLNVSPSNEGVIIISPSSDRWNDFGYRTKIDIRICLRDCEIYLAEGFLGFINESADDSNGIYKLNDLLEKSGGVINSESILPEFFTMLPSMEAYRKLSRKFGVDTAKLVLKSINDVVFYGEFYSAVNWLGLAVRSDVFLKSFMRNTESFFAFKNAGSILRGLDLEEFRRLSSNIAISFQLPGKTNAHSLVFRFDHHAELPKRIAVIIGENGVGKSQTLGRIVGSALTANGALIDADTLGRPLFNRILAFAPTNETGSVFPSDRRTRPKVWYKRFSLNRSGGATKERGSVADLVLQISRSEEYLGSFSRWDIFLESLEAINRWEEICFKDKNDPGKFYSLGDLRAFGEEKVLNTYASIDIRKEPVRVISGVGYPLSSGEISFLRFATQASLCVENGSLLLLDEPETHLHPSFISMFVLLLNRLLELSGSAAIIATHSVYFVREVFPEQVTILRVNKYGEVEIPTTALQTFGADVGAISYFVFNEDEPSKLALEVEKRLLDSYDSWDVLYDKYKDKLSLEILSSLRRALEAKGNE